MSTTRVAGVRRVVPPSRSTAAGGGLADLGHQLHVQLVGELQRADRVAGLGRGALDRHRVHALAEHRQALVDHRADDPAGVEAAAVVDHDRGLADLPSPRRAPWPRRSSEVLLAADDLDERHLVDRREEVQPDEVVGRLTPSASSVIGSVEVLEHSSASGLTTSWISREHLVP